MKALNVLKYVGFGILGIGFVIAGDISASRRSGTGLSLIYSTDRS